MSIFLISLSTYRYCNNFFGARMQVCANSSLFLDFQFSSLYLFWLIRNWSVKKLGLQIFSAKAPCLSAIAGILEKSESPLQLSSVLVLSPNAIWWNMMMEMLLCSPIQPDTIHIYCKENYNYVSHLTVHACMHITFRTHRNSLSKL